MVLGAKNGLVALVLLFAFQSWMSPSQSQASETYFPELGKIVSSYLTYYHYEKHRLNDEIAQRTLDNYLDSLDFNRLFFLASDIDSFRKFESSLDDDLRASPCRLDKAFLIHERFKERVLQRIPVILTCVAEDFDFTKQESILADRSEEPWPESEAALNAIWRKRIKESVLRFDLQGKAREDTVELLTKRYNRLKKEIEETEPLDVLERFLTAMCQSYDPHSQYFKPASKDNFDIDMGHSLEGIGTTLRREGEYTVVVSVVPGGPADLSGEIRPKAKIVAVAQGDDEPVDIVDMRLDKVVKLIRGKKGTTVQLTIIPADAMDESETKVVRLIRDKVVITANDARSEVREIPGSDGKVHRVGVITIPSFYLDTRARFMGDPDYKSTTRDVRKLLAELDTQDIEGLLVDLRSNSGGSLDEAVELTGLFIKSGPVVQVLGQSDTPRILRDPDSDLVYEGPLVVLTSVFSASASEIFAGAIQDYGRGLVVGGEATHGKGTVQNLINLNPALEQMMGKDLPEKTAGALKLTTNKFYRVSGASTQIKGVVADVPLPSPFDRYEVSEASLDYALPWDEIVPAPHEAFGDLSDVVPELRAASQERVKQNQEFKYLEDDLDRWDARRKENRISLNLEARKKEKEENEAREEARKKARETRQVEQAQSKKPPKSETDAADTDADEANEAGEDEGPDFILDESVQILVDFILLHRGGYVAEASEMRGS